MNPAQRLRDTQWFTDDELPGLRDFWQVYDIHYSEIQAAVMLPLLQHDKFGPILRTMSQEQQDAQTQDSRRILNHAVANNDFSIYAQRSRSQGAMCAKLGVSFGDFYFIMRLFGRYMLPKLVAAYCDEPLRLVQALGTMQEVLDRAMALVGEAYNLAVEHAAQLDRQKSEAALRESKARLRLLLDNIQDYAIFMLDLDGNVAVWSAGAERIKGYRAEEIVGRHFSCLNPGPGREAHCQLALATAAATGRFEEEGWRCRKDGSRFWANAVLTAIRDSQERLLGFAQVTRDLTATKAAEAVLRKSEETLAATLAALQEGIVIIDPARKIVYRNPAAQRMVRSSATHLPEYQGIYFADGLTLCPPEQLPLARVLRGETVRECEMFLRNAEMPTGIHLCVSASAIRDRDGALLGAVSSFRDESYRWQLEEQRSRAVESELQSRRMQEASRLKSEFLANMSHELRTPLNSIIGFSELLHDGRVGPLTPKQREFLGDILVSGRHLLQLINDILDLSKIESGKMEFHPEPIDLTRMVPEIISILRHTAAAKSIQIECFLGADLGEIVLDAARLKQVLYNYLSNALKFTPEGGRIIVRVEPASPLGWKLTVEDTGIGIAAVDLQRLFVAFQQLEAGAAKEHAGTGLGLAFTKQLVEAQGGSVGVASELGVGSRFYAILPRRISAGAANPGLSAAGPSPAAGHCTVLVIEDNLKDQEAIAHTLLGAGYGVEFATTGARAMAMSKERTYAAITLDLILPDTSGLEVLRAIRAEGKNQAVPVVVITVVSEKTAVESLVSEILNKPLYGASLLAALQRVSVFPRH